MPSKTLFFNGTIFRKNLVRLWPIWSFYLLIWLFVMPVQLWGTMTAHTYGTPDTVTLGNIITMNILRRGFVTGSSLIAVFGVLAAMGVFSYLYSGRSSTFFHALPIRREGLFLTQYVSGLSFLMIPNVVVFLASAAVTAAGGFFNPEALLSWLGIVSAWSLLFYSFGAFCAMFTGHIVALPVFYAVLNLLAVGVELLIKMVLSTFVFGMTHNRNISLGILSPWYKMNTMNYAAEYRIACWGLVVGYAAAGLVLAVLALLVYRKRPVESAGDVVAIRPVRPVFKYGASFCCALLFGTIVNTVFGSVGAGGGFLAILIGMLAAGFVGYVASDMLLKKTFRVFKRGLRGWLVFSAVTAVLVLAVRLDLFGYERRVPEAAEVSRVYIGSYINPPTDGGVPTYYYGMSFDDSGRIARVTALHSDIVAGKAAIQRYQATPPDASGIVTNGSESVSILYVLQDGRTLLRSYTLPVTEALLKDAGSPAAQYQALQNDPDSILNRNFPVTLTEYNFDNGIANPGYNPGKNYANGVTEHAAVSLRQSVPLSQAQSYALYQAIVEDIKAGQIGKTYLLTNEAYYNSVYTYSVFLSFSGTFPDWGRSNNSMVSISAQFELEKTSANTIAALKDMGLLDESQLLTQGAARDARLLVARSSDVPEDIAAFYITYMDALKSGTREAEKYTHFENGDRDAYLASNDTLADYEIIGVERINDRLYAVTASVPSAPGGGGGTRTVYNFVGILDGRLAVMINEIHIPDELRDNLNPDKYRYSDPDDLGPGS